MRPRWIASPRKPIAAMRIALLAMTGLGAGILPHARMWLNYIGA